MAQGVEGLKASNLLAIGVDGAYFVDGEHFHRVGPPHVRGDRIFILPQVELDGLGDLRKEVDHGGASQAKSLLRELQLQPLDSSVPFDIGEKKDNFDRILEAGGGYTLQTAKIDEKKLFGKSKILHQQTMAGEGGGGIRKHPLIGTEPHSTKGGGREDHGRRSRTGGKIAHHNAVQAAEE